MANIFRSLSVCRREIPLQTAIVFAATSLLTTTLAASPLPIGKVSLPLQQHLSAPSNYLNADTSRGTPKTLTQDAQLPTQVTGLFPLIAPVRVNPDTSQSAYPLIRPPAVAAPFFNAPSFAVDFFRQPSNTTSGTPKPLYADATISVVNKFLSAPWSNQSYPDTSKGAYPLTFPPPVVAPFRPFVVYAVDWPRTVVNTSIGTPYTLLTPIVVNPTGNTIEAGVWNLSNTIWSPR